MNDTDVELQSEIKQLSLKAFMYQNIRNYSLLFPQYKIHLPMINTSVNLRSIDILYKLLISSPSAILVVFLL